MSSSQRKSFDYFNNVEGFYRCHVGVLSSLEEKISADFDIPKYIIRDSVKRTLSEVLEGGPKSFLHIGRISFKYRVFYYLVMLFFLFNAAFGKRIKKPISKKIVFDMWNVNGYNYFYKPFLDLLEKDDVLLYVTNQHRSFRESKSCVTGVYSSRYLFDSCISKNILKTQVSCFDFYKSVSERLNINFIYIALNIFRTIAAYNTHVKQVNCRVFFSACDNQFNSLRYYIYKENGIQNVTLLQNGLRTGRWANDAVDLYTYCDYYFGFGIEQINIQKGMVCGNKIPVGSVKLHSMLSRYGANHKKESFDIVFLASYEERDTPYIKVKTYEKIISNLCHFQKKYPNIRIFYSDKEREVGSAKYNSMITRIKASGIACSDSNINNSYEAILHSKVALFYRTTIGLEALAMNKVVLNLNYDNDMIPMRQKNSYAVLLDSNYKKFEDRLMYLLRVDKSEMECYDKLSLEYMNNANYNNIPESILDIVFNNSSKDCDPLSI